jgi:hypothetical protein
MAVVVMVDPIFAGFLPQQTTRMESNTAHPIFIDLPDKLLKISFDWIEFT